LCYRTPLTHTHTCKFLRFTCHIFTCKITTTYILAPMLRTSIGLLVHLVPSPSRRSTSRLAAIVLCINFLTCLLNYVLTLSKLLIDRTKIRFTMKPLASLRFKASVHFKDQSTHTRKDAIPGSTRLCRLCRILPQVLNHTSSYMTKLRPVGLYNTKTTTTDR